MPWQPLSATGPVPDTDTSSARLVADGGLAISSMLWRQWGSPTPCVQLIDIDERLIGLQPSSDHAAGAHRVKPYGRTEYRIAAQAAFRRFGGYRYSSRLQRHSGRLPACIDDGLLVIGPLPLDVVDDDEIA